MAAEDEPLAQQHCKPCEGGMPTLERTRIEELEGELADHWSVVDDHHLSATLEFPDFRSALAFVNRAGAIAESEGHHPELTVTWGRVDIRIWTHAIDGLSDNDFILAAKYDDLVAG